MWAVIPLGSHARYPAYKILTLQFLTEKIHFEVATKYCYGWGLPHEELS